MPVSSRRLAGGLAAALLWIVGGQWQVAGPTEAFGAESGPAKEVLSAEPPGAFSVQPESTRRMAEKIRAIWRSADIASDPFRSAERVELYANAIRSNPPAEAMPELLAAYGLELLQVGRPEEGLKQYDKLERWSREHGQQLGSQALSALWTSQALCELRIGEQTNCLINHNAESCLVPIRGGGVYQVPDGPREAIRLLSRELETFPGDLRARWLLNVAYMNLGEYPEKVPSRWLIDPACFESEYDIKRFPDVAGKLGLDVNDLAGGVVLDDFDHDGFLDLMVSGWGFGWSQLRVFRNNGDGTFSERTSEAGLDGLYGGLNLVQGDYDNDGFVDVLVLRGAWLHPGGRYPNSLLRNNGDFTFTDVTEQAGMLSLHPTQTAAWLDYNADGLLDVFIGNESTKADEHPCELYRNNGDGTFTECAHAHGLDFRAFVKGVVAGDYNNDGRPDLLISVADGPKRLLRNDGPAGGNTSPAAEWRFTDVTAAAGIEEPWMSFPCWFWDYDNDGSLDIFISGYSIQDVGDIAADMLGLPNTGQCAHLYHNNGDGTFSDVSRETGALRLLLTMGCNFGDLDNDGWLDFYSGTGNPDLMTIVPNRMFRNDGGRRFQDVTTSGGFGQLQKGHGIAFGDIDNDGDEDVYSVVGGFVDADLYYNQLFANPGHGNHWIKLMLEGRRSNRIAIGARIKVVVRTDQGTRAIYRTVGSGGSFGGNPMRQEVGLGAAQSVIRVEVFWPTTGATQVFQGLDLDQCYSVREDDPEARLVTLTPFQLPTSPDAPDHHHRPRALPGTKFPRILELCSPAL